MSSKPKPKPKTRDRSGEKPRRSKKKKKKSKSKERDRKKKKKKKKRSWLHPGATGKHAVHDLMAALRKPEATKTEDIVKEIKRHPKTWAAATDRYNTPVLHVLLSWYPGIASPRALAVLKALLEAGADPNEQYGNTLLERAASGDISVIEDAHLIIRALLKGGASPDQRDEHGWTCLHGAACLQTADRGHLIEELVNGGADINARNHKGCTPLHLSPKSVHPAAFFLRLIRCGADARLLDNQGKTALGRIDALHTKYALRRLPEEVRRLIANYKTRQAALDVALKALTGKDDDDADDLSEEYTANVLHFTDGQQRLEILEALLAEADAMLSPYTFPPDLSPPGPYPGPYGCPGPPGTISSSKKGSGKEAA